MRDILKNNFNLKATSCKVNLLVLLFLCSFTFAFTWFAIEFNSQKMHKNVAVAYSVQESDSNQQPLNLFENNNNLIRVVNRQQNPNLKKIKKQFDANLLTLLSLFVLILAIFITKSIKLFSNILPLYLTFLSNALPCRAGPCAF